MSSDISLGNKGVSLDPNACIEVGASILISWFSPIGEARFLVVSFTDDCLIVLLILLTDRLFNEAISSKEVIAAQGNSINFAAELEPDCPLSITSREEENVWNPHSDPQKHGSPPSLDSFYLSLLVAELGQSLHPPPSFSLSATKVNHHKSRVQSIQTNEGQEIPCSGPRTAPISPSCFCRCCFKIQKIFVLFYFVSICFFKKLTIFINI